MHGAGRPGASGRGWSRWRWRSRSCWPGAATAGAETRTPRLLDGKKTLYERVLTRPGAVIAAQPGEAGGKPVPPLSQYYVYDHKQVAGRDWIEVGAGSRGKTDGWIAARGDAAVEAADGARLHQPGRARSHPAVRQARVRRRAAEGARPGRRGGADREGGGVGERRSAGRLDRARNLHRHRQALLSAADPAGGRGGFAGFPRACDRDRLGHQGRRHLAGDGGADAAPASGRQRGCAQGILGRRGVRHRLDDLDGALHRPHPRSRAADLRHGREGGHRAAGQVRPGRLPLLDQGGAEAGVCRQGLRRPRQGDQRPGLPRQGRDAEGGDRFQRPLQRRSLRRGDGGGEGDRLGPSSAAATSC